MKYSSSDTLRFLRRVHQSIHSVSRKTRRARFCVHRIGCIIDVLFESVRLEHASDGVIRVHGATKALRIVTSNLYSNDYVPA